MFFSKWKQVQGTGLYLSKFISNIGSSLCYNHVHVHLSQVHLCEGKETIVTRELLVLYALCKLAVAWFLNVNNDVTYMTICTL